MSDQLRPEKSPVVTSVDGKVIVAIKGLDGVHTREIKINFAKIVNERCGAEAEVGVVHRRDQRINSRMAPSSP